jgi:5'-methylthioadenosine phosphorylase
MEPRTPPIERLDEPPTLGENVTGALINGSITFSIRLADRAERAITLPTPAGESPPFYLVRHNGVPFWYVHFHGVDFMSAHDNVQVGFTRTWYVLHRLGIRDVISGAAVGGIRADMQPGDVVVLTDFIDFSTHRPRSMLTEIWERLPWIGGLYEPPMCDELSGLLRECASAYDLGTVHPEGVLGQGEGHRFESPAEIRRMRAAGADMVAHHQASEAIYARELGIHFGAISYVSNIAPGLASDPSKAFVTDEQAKAGYALCANIMLEAMARAASRTVSCTACPQDQDGPVKVRPEDVKARPIFR